jgi:hypothetical protein
VGFNPSTQRHYRKLIYYFILHSYMFWSYDHHQVENILLSRTTQLTTDPWFYNTRISNITVIVRGIIKQRIRCQLSSPR